MNSRERVKIALDHTAPDRIPLDIGCGKCCNMHIDFYRRLIRHLGIDEEAVVANKISQTAHASDAVLEKLECDVRSPFPAFTTVPPEEWEDEEYVYFRDGMGNGFRMPKSAPLYFDIHEFPLADERNRAKFRWPEPFPINPDGVAQMERYHTAGYPVIFIDHYADGFLQTGNKLYGYDGWMVLLALADEEDEVRIRLDQLLERKMQHYDNLVAVYGDRLDIVCDTDDLGTQIAPFLSPEMFRNLLKPYWAKLFAHIKKVTSAKILMHSCGSIRPIIGDLIEIGLDILNPIQISAANMDPFELKREFGKDLSFWGGGVDTQYVLPSGTPQEVRDNVKRNIDALAKDGGFVFSTVHNIQADVPLKNFFAMWETFMDHRVY